MAFNVSDFKTQVKDWLRPFSYEVVIQPPTNIPLPSREIALRTETVVLPSGALMTTENKPYGGGLTLNIPYSQQSQIVSCTHTVDSNGEMIQYFFNWMDYIADINGDQRFTAAYFDDYVSRVMEVNLYDLSGNKVKTYELFDVFPVTAAQSPMGWANSQDTVKLEVSYRYRNYTVK